MDKNLGKTSVTKLRVFILATMALSVVGIALHIINLFFFYDNAIGYYSADAVLPTVMNIFFVAAFVFIIIGSAIFARAPYTTTGTESNVITLIIGILCAIPFAILRTTPLSYALDMPSPLLYLIATAASLASCVYFILTAVNKCKNTRTVLAIAVIVTFVYILATSYFNVYVQMNSPRKILLHIACMSAMLFFLSEARCIIGDMRKRFYVFSLCSALFFTGVYAIPSYIADLAEINQGYTFRYFDTVFIAVFAYLVLRAVMLIITADKAAPCEESTEIQNDERI